MITGGSQKVSQRVLDERTDKDPVGEFYDIVLYISSLRAVL
jgi:hypothetical protein